MLDVTKDNLTVLYKVTEITEVNEELISQYVTNCEALLSEIDEVHHLKTILEAYSNILIGRKGREGLWKFENEEVGPYRVTINKPSPRDLPNVSIISSVSKEPIPLSLLVDRTRDKLVATISQVEGPLLKTAKEIKFAGVIRNYRDLMSKIMAKVEDQNNDVKIAYDHLKKQQNLTARMREKCVALQKEKDEVKRDLKLSLFAIGFLLLAYVIMVVIIYQG
jgi:hypothetical protein